MMKILLFIFFLFSFLNISYGASVSDVFSDISDDYKYKDELQELYDKGILKDSSNGLFEPYSLISRSDFVGIVSEVSCKKCIQPSPSPDLVSAFSGEPPFYDVSKNDNNYYCIAFAENTGMVSGYDKSYTCANGVSRNGERPFCPGNYVTREEAIAVLLRNSSIYSTEENDIIKQKIASGEITSDLSEDVKPKEIDGSVNTFYGYFKKALEYDYSENKVDSSGNVITKNYKIVELVDDKLYPEKFITKEEYIRMAYVIFKSNSCNFEDDKDDFSLDIEVFDKICEYGSETCTLSKFDDEDNIYDFKANLDDSKNATCSWNFNYLGETTTGYKSIVYGNYVDNYSFVDDNGDLLVGKWRVTSNCENNKGETATSYVELETGDNENDLGISIDADPISGTSPVLVNLKGISDSSEYTYEWHINGEIINGKNIEYLISESGVYPVKLVATKPDGTTLEAKTVLDYTKIKNQDTESNLASKINIYDKDCNSANNCSPSKIDSPDNIYDIEGIIEGSKTEIPEENYTWEFKYLGTENGNYEKNLTGKYLNDYNFGDLYGDWEITLNGEDIYGNITSSKSTITIVNSSLIDSEKSSCYVGANPIFGEYDLETGFSAVGCLDSDFVSWDFGDGEKGTGKDATHTYGKPGIYEVVMTTISGSGTKYDTVTVRVIPITDGEVGAGAEYRYESGDSKTGWGTSGINPEGGFGDVCSTGFTVDFKTSFSGAEYYWNLGDGNLKSGKEISHTYTKPGYFEVVLNVKTVSGDIYSDVKNIKIGDFGSEFELLTLLQNCANKGVDEESDVDGDGIPDSQDLCPTVSGDVVNRGCPVLTDYCSTTDNSCSSGYACDTSTNTCQFDSDRDSVPDTIDECKFRPGDKANKGCPAEKDTCLFPKDSSVIFGEAVCNTCPCINKTDYLSSFRNCDIIFGAILSPDQTEIYSKGNNFLIEDK